MSAPDLAREILHAAAVRRGHWRYESGHHGTVWLDLDRLLARPARTRAWAAALAARLATRAATVACGPMTGGALLAQLVAAELDIGLVWTERRVGPDGAARYVLPPGAVSEVAGRGVVLVDDAVNAGSALLGSCAALREAGAAVVAAGALLALGDAAGRVRDAGGPELLALARLDRPLWPAAACPLCAAGVPLEPSPA
jgi:orotate phosphoribosyltransferase